MISAKPTEHLTGVLIEGEYEDYYEMVESIYRMTGLEEDYNDRYWSVKNLGRRKVVCAEPIQGGIWRQIV